MVEDGFASVTPLSEARERLREVCAPHGRTECRPIADAADRVLATDVTAERPVPHYDRAAMDGFAVRAEDTFEAGARSPVRLAVLDAADDGDSATDGDRSVGAGEAVQVHTGSAMPDGADAVVRVERTGLRDGDVLVRDAVTVGEDVGAAGEDVDAGEHLFDAGHRLRPTDLALLRSTGRNEVEVAESPRVRVLPTGEELVAADQTPAPGEVVETNGLLVASLVEQWGGAPEYDDVVTDDAAALREAIESGAEDCDLVVTTGGSSVGERDLVPDVVADAGELVVHGLAIRPGHPAGFGVVEDTPVLCLPGYPVSCLVTAVQLLRPALASLAGTDPEPLPTVTGRLAEKLPSAPGERTFARVRLRPSGERPSGESSAGVATAEETTDEHDDEHHEQTVEETRDAVAAESQNPADDEGGVAAVDEHDEPAVELLRTSGAGVMSSVAFADGWVVVPESREGIPAGETVPVQRWDGCAPPARTGEP